MNIPKQELKRLIENAFKMGMIYGYSINHENIEEDENNAWENYKKTVREIN